MCDGEENRFAEMFTKHWLVMQELRKRICSGQILYIGAGAGACVAGSQYGTVDTLQVIPASISVSDNEEQLAKMPSKHGRQVNLTKQTGLIVFGEDACGFVI